MKKHYLLFLGLKIIKLLIVLVLFSCEGKKSEPAKLPDTILVDSIPGNTPEDSVIYRNDDEDEDENEEENSNPLVPEEG